MGPISCFLSKIAHLYASQRPFVFVLVKLKMIFPSNRGFIGCLIRISVKVLFHDMFCTEATFGQKWLKNSIFHYDFIILESTESRFPTPFVSIRNHRTSPFCLLLWTFGTAHSSTFVRMCRLITRVTRVGISKTLSVSDKIWHEQGCTATEDG